MLRIRLKRVGRRNDSAFRVVVVDSRRSSQTGRVVEEVGSYNPKTKQTSLTGERIKHWIAAGAQVSDTLHNLLVKSSIISGKKRNVLPRKSPVVRAAPEGKEAAPAGALPEEEQGGAAAPETAAAAVAEGAAVAPEAAASEESA